MSHFQSCFDPPHQSTCPLVWLANNFAYLILVLTVPKLEGRAVCCIYVWQPAFFIDGRCRDLVLKMCKWWVHNKQSVITHISLVNTQYEGVAPICVVQHTVGLRIVGTSLSFSFSHISVSICIAFHVYVASASIFFSITLSLFLGSSGMLISNTIKHEHSSAIHQPYDFHSCGNTCMKGCNKTLPQSHLSVSEKI